MVAGVQAVSEPGVLSRLRGRQAEIETLCGGAFTDRPAAKAGQGQWSSQRSCQAAGYRVAA